MKGALCRICPRKCGVDRAERQGYCQMTDEIYVARCAPHAWEEPPISGERGSGTVFFSGCNLRCVFCQNHVISHDRRGRAVTEDELADMLMALADTGVHNLNLVTPTHYTPQLVRVLERIKPDLHIPVVWNSSGYESPETLSMLDGLVDIYLPDFKYVSSKLSASYSGAPDYAEVASAALATMLRQVGQVQLDADGMMRKGMIVRHLVLPGCRKDSIAVVRRLATLLPVQDFKLSLMRQYTPEFAVGCPYANLHRRVTDFEYRSVVDEAMRLGFDGYTQGRDAATSDYTPRFEWAEP